MGGRSVLLQVNPNDLGLLEKKREEFQQQLSMHLSIEGVESLHRGECRVCGDWGEVDAGLKVQLRNLTDAILGGVHGESE